MENLLNQQSSFRHRLAGHKSPVCHFVNLWNVRLQFSIGDAFGSFGKRETPPKHLRIILCDRSRWLMLSIVIHKPMNRYSSLSTHIVSTFMPQCKYILINISIHSTKPKITFKKDETIQKMIDRSNRIEKFNEMLYPSVPCNQFVQLQQLYGANTTRYRLDVALLDYVHLGYGCSDW